MKLGVFSVAPAAPVLLARIAADAQRVRFSGIPRVPGSTAAEIAQSVLKQNAHDVLWAGQGHFHYMWVADFGKALRGAYHALPADYLDNLIDVMIEESGRLGEVPSCFGKGGKGFNMPYARADSLPWLVFSVHERQLRRKRTALLPAHKRILQRLLDSWWTRYVEETLVSPRVTGDWMDTVLRPSSTYNNLCALAMYTQAQELGLRSPTGAVSFEKALLKDRLRGSYVTDYAGTERPSVDGAVLALYLGLFDAKLRGKLADWLGSADVTEPYPIRSSVRPYPASLITPIARLSPSYHSVAWLHLGLMYVNGLKKLGRDVMGMRTNIDELTVRYGNILETLDGDKPYQTALFATEYGLTMAAGQLLELEN